MSGFFHGVTVTNVDTGTRTLALPSSSIIGLVDTFTEGPTATAKAAKVATTVLRISLPSWRILGAPSGRPDQGRWRPALRNPRHPM